MGRNARRSAALFVALALCGAGRATAQQPPTSHVAVVGGVSSMTLATAQAPDTARALSKAVGGVSLRWRDRSRIGLITDVLVMPRDYTEDARGAVDVIYTSRLLQVPVLARVP